MIDTVPFFQLFYKLKMFIKVAEKKSKTFSNTTTTTSMRLSFHFLKNPMFLCSMSLETMGEGGEGQKIKGG
jgi:hypothetical protein